MKISVIVSNGQPGVVNSTDLDRLIQENALLAFHRSDEWVRVGFGEICDPQKARGTSWRDRKALSRQRRIHYEAKSPLIPQEITESIMKKGIHTLLLVFYLAAFMLATAQQAQAALGQSIDSVASDRKTLSAVQRATTTRTGYSVQELKSDANLVREYISPSGVVFAIAWNGLSHPDLTPLLGTYVGEYQEALRHAVSQKGKRHSQVKATNVIVEKWGHMRNMQGRAYIPTSIPNGVSIDEIK